MKAVKTIFLIFAIIFFHSTIYADLSLNEYVESVSLNLNQNIDLANLEYDDSPYPGRTNIGHLFIPYVLTKTRYVDLSLGGWYKHMYVQFDDDTPPEKVYPYMSAVFRTGVDSDFTLGNFDNLAPFPNSIYNEFIYFKERPVCSGMRFSFDTKTFDMLAYLDWTKLDTEEHPEEFLVGLIIDHDLFTNLYYNFYNHYHHRGGQLNKDTHPVRVEQDIVASPLIGLNVFGLFVEGQYYLSIFSQNFEPSIYGQAGSFLVGYSTKTLTLSYQCFYNYDYYHQDAHLFYLKKKNLLNRLRVEYNLFRFKDILDMLLTFNLYGMDPPGLDMRLFAKINLNIFEYKSKDEEMPSFPSIDDEASD